MMDSPFSLLKVEIFVTCRFTITYCQIGSLTSAYHIVDHIVVGCYRLCGSKLGLVDGWLDGYNEYCEDDCDEGWLDVWLDSCQLG